MTTLLKRRTTIIAPLKHHDHLCTFLRNGPDVLLIFRAMRGTGHVDSLVFYAHSLPGLSETSWEPLEKHLSRVAELSAGFAETFGARDWGWILGGCHDLGKYSEEFQRYIRAANGANAGAEDPVPGRVDHSTFGARFVAERIDGYPGQLLAFAIAGHHAGMPDATSDDDATQKQTLQFRLYKKQSVPPVDCPEVEFPTRNLRSPFSPDSNIGFQLAFFTRILFSCLVDADRLATEEFCNPEQSTARSQPRPQLAELKRELDFHLSAKQHNLPSSPINRARVEVLSRCREAASATPGFFSLNVPTGGGKTLSAMAFALEHCIQHGLHRVVMGMPFTSIIEQNADVYRKAFGSLGKQAVVEHHTNLHPTRRTRANELGSENWDAPVIVTTNVQLFESLFAAATTPCRKLHRLARSVIILDEAQALPVDLLQPALAGLKELVRNYGCSIVLCTATQPALERRSGFDIGIDGVRHIIPDPDSLFLALRRVEVQWLGRLSSEELADRLSRERSVLCVVNTRAEAKNIFDMLERSASERDGCFHLSTLMCAEHRRRDLAAIRERLAAREPCRVVSTQLIEAGVDLDFAVVYRAITGFDSIAQAAGRCNREGLLDLGRVYVFETDTPPPAGLLRDAAQPTKELIAQYGDPLMPEAIRAYFQLFYWSQNDSWDKHQVMRALRADGGKFLTLQFRRAASSFKMIRDNQLPVFVPYDERGCALFHELLKTSDGYVRQRDLQPYLVPVHERLLRILETRNLVLEHASGVWLLMNQAAYSPRTGLTAESFGIESSLLVI